jgi:methionyl-tRNA formyltransferase
LKVIFAGTPPFAAHALKELHQAGHEIVLVMTQPDRPAGRGLKLQPSAVKQVALDLNLPIIQPTSLKLDGKYAEEAQAAKAVLENTDFDVMVVAAYGLILPQWTLALAELSPRAGCLNIHASLLPRWRGAAPIQRAIWSGDQKTGTCIMQMDVGLDTGAVALCEELPIYAFDTTATLHDKLALQGGRLIQDALSQISQGGLTLTPQTEVGVTYAEKILKDEAQIDWIKDAQWIDRQIRALNPMPGAWTKWQDNILKVWFSELVSPTLYSDNKNIPGQVIAMDDLGVIIACGQGSIRLQALQKAGGKKINALEFAKQNHLNIGDRLSS